LTDKAAVERLFLWVNHLLDALIHEFLPVAAPILLAYTMGCGAGYSAIQSIKMARREARAPKLSHSTLRILSFLIAGLTTFLVARYLLNLSFEDASIHGVSAGLFYPIVMTIVMTWCKKHNPAVYDRLRISRRREKENPNHDDTGTHFF
jgi:MFS family permease